MDAALVAGCGAVGAIGGWMLDAVSSRLAAAAVAAASDRQSGERGGGDGVPEDPGPPMPRAADRPAAPARAAQPATAAPAPATARLERAGAAATTALLLALAGARLGPEPVLAAYCLLFAGLVAISVVDLRAWVVPRRLLYPLLGAVAVALVAASAADGRWRALGDAVLGGAIAFAALFVAWFAYPRGMGFGDVRLAGVIGMGLGWLGLLHLYVGFLVAFLTGAAFGLVLMVARGSGRKTRLPFAPALAVGAVVGVLWGSAIIGAWLPGHA
ncbi:MAG TPA: A24 family peptidase [Acidimicrobiales bacterium]|nr:A24 family peptidase [Acidimicrobiales bacterium]